MISVAGSGVAGRFIKGPKNRPTLFIAAVVYTYTPLDDLHEKVRVLSAPPLVGTGGHLGKTGNLPVNGHRDCSIPVRYISEN